MLPPPWTGIVLTLAAFRLARLVGWDDFPPIRRTRDWLVGAGDQLTGPRRRLLDDFLGCPWCQGFWLSAGVYVAWLLEPTGTLYAAAPFALSAAVGLIAKNLDP